MCIGWTSQISLGNSWYGLVLCHYNLKTLVIEVSWGPACPPRLPHGDLRGADDGDIRGPVQRPARLPHGAGLLQQQGDLK